MTDAELGELFRQVVRVIRPVVRDFIREELAAAAKPAAPELAKPAPPADVTTDLVDDRFLAAHSPISRVTWQTWRSHGEGPRFFRIKRRCLYSWADVQAWLAARRAGGGQ